MATAKLPEYFNISQKVKVERVQDLVISAWEGGSTYWCESNGRWMDMFKGHTIEVQDMENKGKKYEVSLADMENALALMAEQYPKYFGDFIAGDEDADTADIFWQLTVLGDVIYG